MGAPKLPTAPPLPGKAPVPATKKAESVKLAPTANAALFTAASTAGGLIQGLKLPLGTL